MVIYVQMNGAVAIVDDLIMSFFVNENYYHYHQQDFLFTYQT
jgi:hypothetical protein